MKLVKMYDDDDLLKADEAADHFGYSRDYFRSMLQISDKAADPKLIRLRIKTDETWRKVNRSRAQYVFPYGALVAWYEAKQRRPSVKAKAWARRHTASPLL